MNYELMTMMTQESFQFSVFSSQLSVFSLFFVPKKLGF